MIVHADSASVSAGSIIDCYIDTNSLCGLRQFCILCVCSTLRADDVWGCVFLPAQYLASLDPRAVVDVEDMALRLQADYRFEVEEGEACVVFHLLSVSMLAGLYSFTALSTYLLKLL